MRPPLLIAWLVACAGRDAGSDGDAPADSAIASDDTEAQPESGLPGDTAPAHTGETALLHTGDTALLHTGDTAAPPLCPSPAGPNRRISGVIDLSTADAKYTGTAKYAFAGERVSPAGDVNGDGLADLLVGASGEDSQTNDYGAYFLLHGPANVSDTLFNAADTWFTSAAPFPWDDDSIGESQAVGLGDIDGDGLGDLLIGASDALAVYLVLGSSITAGDVGLDLADTTFTFVPLLPSDLGNTLHAPGDIDMDGVPDLVIGDAGAPEVWDGVDRTWQGAAFVWSGASVPLGTSTQVDGAQTELRGEYFENFAALNMPVQAGDLDADGINDLLVGAISNDAAGEDAGRLYVFYTPLPLGVVASADADAWRDGEGVEHLLGFYNDHAGDVNGDGYGDALTTGLTDYGGTAAGSAYLFHGPVVGTDSAGTADVRLDGEDADHRTTVVAGAGDLDQDGFADILVGSVNNGDMTYLIYGPITSGVHDIGLRADAELIGENVGDKAWRAAGVGDVDGDCYPDLLVGAYTNDTLDTDAGAAYLLLGGFGP